MGTVDSGIIPVEVRGVRAEVDRSRLGDMDVLEQLYDMTECYERHRAGEATDAELTFAMVPFARTLFGRAQWDRVKAELRGTCGDEPHFVSCIRYVFDALDEASRVSRGELKNC